MLRDAVKLFMTSGPPLAVLIVKRQSCLRPALRSCSSSKAEDRSLGAPHLERIVRSERISARPRLENELPQRHFIGTAHVINRRRRPTHLPTLNTQVDALR